MVRTNTTQSEATVNTSANDAILDKRNSKQVLILVNTIARIMLLTGMRSIGLVAAALAELIVNENLGTQDIQEQLDYEEMILCGLFWAISLLIFIPFPAWRLYRSGVWPRDMSNIVCFIVQEFLAITIPFAFLLGLKTTLVFQQPGGYKVLLFFVLIVVSVVVDFLDVFVTSSGQCVVIHWIKARC